MVTAECDKYLRDLALKIRQYPNVGKMWKCSKRGEVANDKTQNPWLEPADLGPAAEPVADLIYNHSRVHSDNILQRTFSECK